MTDRDRMVRVKAIFLSVADLSADERERALSEQCGGDAQLRRFVVRMIEAYDRGDPSFLDEEGSTALATTAAPMPERIGPYHLLERIGEGGMGTVYLGEQTQPIRRKVAVKVLKAGMDSQSVLARFEAERQALALMDHANIAKVLDAGETAEGRPYFAMEWVKGEPITKYCDAKNLSNRQRLELFIPVCLAIQHAHQKGVIHRDLKPSNVLVMEQDGLPVAKVIDFGIAKAISAPLTDKTLHTRIGQFLGTPEYMSPEQARVGTLDVDTRADVYSLGVMLYELLTGALPFSSEVLRKAGYEEILRIIREEEPPKPSTRVSTLGAGAGDAARRRHTDLARLSKELRGDLDWVILRSLEKDRSRRYESASAVALEIRRYLNDEPVLAGPPSTAYRLRKFVRRHRVGVTVASALLLAVVIAAGALTWSLVESNRQRRAAEEARAQAAAVKDFLTEMLHSPEPGEEGKDVTVKEVLDRAVTGMDHKFRDHPLVEAEVRQAIAETYAALGLRNLALPHATRALQLFEQTFGPSDRRTIDCLIMQATAKGEFGDGEGSQLDFREALRRSQVRYGNEDSTTVAAMRNLALWLVIDAKYIGEVESLLVQARDAVAVAPWRTDAWDAGIQHGFSFLYGAQGDWERQVESIQREITLLEKFSDRLAPDHITARNNMAMALARMGRRNEAIVILEGARDDCRKVYGEDSRHVEIALTNLGTQLLENGQPEKAEEEFRHLVEQRRRCLGDKHHWTLLAHARLANTWLAQGRAREAASEMRRVLNMMQSSTSSSPEKPRGADLGVRGYVLRALGASLVAMDSLQTAEPFLLEAATLERDLPHRPQEEAHSTKMLLALYERLGEKERAASWRTELETRSESRTAMKAK